MNIDELPTFQRLSTLDRAFNRCFGFLVGLGFGLKHNYLLVVHGRKTGRAYETPVNILNIANKRYLVAPRGEAQWVRNVRVNGEVVLKKGRTEENWTLAELVDREKPAILQCYLGRFRPTVARYFPIPAESDAALFAQIAPKYPVFELTSSASEIA